MVDQMAWNVEIKVLLVHRVLACHKRAKRVDVICQPLITVCNAWHSKHKGDRIQDHHFHKWPCVGGFKLQCTIIYSAAPCKEGTVEARVVCMYK